MRFKPTQLFFLFLFFFFTLSSCKKIPHDADQYLIKGIDVSHYQKNINWKTVSSDTTLSFVFIKATEGESWRDTLFAENWRSLGTNRLLRGAYHYYLPSVSAQKQADNFIRSVQLKTGDLPPVLDIEVRKNINAKQFTKDIKLWLSLVEKNYGVKPIIYTYEDFYLQYLLEDFEGYPLWIARYDNREPRDIDWAFWQYSDWGRVSGIDGQVDYNVYEGSLKKLKKMTVQ